jgi:hypothetical protein
MLKFWYRALRMFTISAPDSWGMRQLEFYCRDSNTSYISSPHSFPIQSLVKYLDIHRSIVESTHIVFISLTISLYVSALTFEAWEKGERKDTGNVGEKRRHGRRIYFGGRRSIILSRDLVTIDGVWICNGIYWTFPQLVTALCRSLSHRIVFSVTVFLLWLVTSSNSRRFSAPGLTSSQAGGHLLPTSYSSNCIGGGFEYLHRSPASRKRRRKENTVVGGITGQPCSWGI